MSKPKDFNDLNNEELREEAFRLLALEFIGIETNTIKKNSLFEACNKKNPGIWEIALGRAIDFSDNYSSISENYSLIPFNPETIIPLEEAEKLIKPVLLDFLMPKDSIPEDFFDIRHRQSEDLIYCGVEGDSMTGSGIEKGDILIVSKKAEILDGSVVLVLLEGLTFVKRYKIEPDCVRLVSDNPNYPDFRLNDELNFSILGVVQANIKKIK